MLPFDMNMILSDLVIVDNLCAIVITVLPSDMRSIESCTSCSDIETRAQVASSNIKIDGSGYIDLARASI